MLYQRPGARRSTSCEQTARGAARHLGLHREESHRPIAGLPQRVAVSVVTIGELQLGVLAATDPEPRARRADTLALARTADPIPVSEAVMVAWARLVADCRAAGIQRTVKLTDALIAATAIEHGLPVVTQDDDFATIANAHPQLTVIHV